MNIPDFLYGLNAKALAGGLLELWTNRLSQTQAAAQHILSSLVVPVDRVVVLHHIEGRFTPGAAQTFKTCQIVDVDPDGNVIGPVLGGTAVLAGLGTVDFLFGTAGLRNCYVIGPGHSLQATVDYSAGGAANTTDILVQGWMIPRGKIQLAGAQG